MRRRRIGALPVAADVGREEDIANLVVGHDRAVRADRPVRLERRDRDRRWRRDFHGEVAEDHQRQPDVRGVRGAKYAIPHMLEQGSGYLLNVASAAGLLVIFDTVAYTVTKHAAVGFTEWLAATYDDQGIRRQSARPGRGEDADPGRQGGHPGGPGRDHHGAARRDRHSGARRGAVHDQHASVGAREVRGQGARLRGVHRDDARRSCRGRVPRRRRRSESCTASSSSVAGSPGCSPPRRCAARQSR